MKKLTHVIYKLTFPNGKYRIGLTKDYNARLGHYRRSAFNSNSREYTSYVSKGIRKYGWDNVRKEIVKRCTEETVDKWETFYIAKYKASDSKFGYNLESGGRRHKTHAVESKLKMSKSKKGYKNPFFGKKHSIETLSKLSEIRSNYNLGKFGKNSVKAKPVYQIDLQTGRVIKKWHSGIDACKKLGISPSHLAKVCKGKAKTAVGYIWVYEKNYSTEDIKKRLKNLVNGGCKSIVQINVGTRKIIKRWQSAKRAGASLGICPSHITAVCKNRYRNRTAGGFKWKYA